MFGFLKDKLKKIKDVFTKATTQEVEEKPKKAQQPPKQEQKPSKQQKQPAKKEIQKEKHTKKTVEKEKPAPPKKQKEETKKVLEEIPVTPDLDALEEESIDEETDELHEEEIEEKAAAEEQEEIVAEEEEEIEPVVEEKDDIEQEPIEEELPQEKKRSFLDRILGRKKEEKIEETQKEEKQLAKEVPKPESKPEQKTIAREEHKKPVAKVEPQEESTGFFGKLKAAITTKKLERAEYDKIFDELEMELLENNVALEVVDKIKEDLWQGISSERFNRFGPEKRVQAALAQSISELFIEPFDILEQAKKKDIYIICAIGINGSGKTTTLAKLAQYFKDNKLEPVLAAGDTFRAAAIQQLEEHADRIGVKIIKQQYGADSAAVAFDAIQYAKANKCRVVLIDTAGRLHSNTNLMEEMKKIVRVAKPDATIFIGEATTGNDCVEQAVQFSQAVQIDGIVLSKVDVDERGGAALSISYVTRKPILFFGTGQSYKDLEPFDRDKIVESLIAD